MRAQQGDIVRAKADAEAALKLNPETFWAWAALSVLYGGDEKFDECIAVETIMIRLRPDNPLGWRNRALSYFQKGEYHQAIADANIAIKLGPKGPGQWMTRSAAHGALGELDKALADAEAAVGCAGNDPQVYDARANVYARMGKIEKAEADWKKAETIDPTRKNEPRGALRPQVKPPERKKLTPERAAERDRLLKKAEDSWDQKQFDECKKAIDQAFDIDPTSPLVRTIRGMLLNEMGQFAEATREFNEAIRLDPKFARAYVARGKLHVSQGKLAEGIADITIGLTVDDKDHQAWNIRGWAYALRKQYYQAFADFNESLKRKPDFALALSNRGMCYITLGEYAKAVGDYERVAGYQPHNPKWHMFLSVLKAKLGRQKEADHERQAAIAAEPSLKDAPLPDLPEPLPPLKKDPEFKSCRTAKDQARLSGLLARGRQLVHDAQFGELGPIADEAVQIDSESPGAFALRATYRAFRNDIVRARDDVRSGSQAEPRDATSAGCPAHLEALAGKFDEAITDLTVAIRLDPTDSVAWANRASCYFSKKEYRQSIADATKAINLGFPRENAHLNRAAAHACLGEYDKALADYDTAAKRATQNPAVFNQRSGLHARLGHEEKAAADWDRAKELDKTLTKEMHAVFPDPLKPPERKKLTERQKADFATAMGAAEAAWGKDLFAECAKAVDTACGIDPTSAAARSLRARLWGKRGQFEKAIAEATEAIRLDPDNAWAYAARGSSRNRLKDDAGAIGDFTIALALDPKNHIFWNNRAFAYLDRGQPYQALVDAEKSLRLKPDNSPALQNCGACYLEFGDYPKALALYLKVVERAAGQRSGAADLCRHCRQAGAIRRSRQAEAENDRCQARTEGRKGHRNFRSRCRRSRRTRSE